MEEINYDDNFDWDPTDNDNFQNKNSDYDEPQKIKVPNRFKEVKVFRPPESSREIWVDGGSRILNTDSGKRYVGSWAFYDKESDTLHGKAEDKSTNNQMELMAAIRALEFLNESGHSKEDWVTINLDSEYVRMGILFWTKKWIKNNWTRVTSDGRVNEIKNLELWKKLYELNASRKIYWKHVKAHSGNEYNEKVDIHCGMLMDSFVKEAKIIIK